jgi:predicted polyphosphate/ATP-dependent NAD kinase
MGADEARACGLDAAVAGEPAELTQTTAADTEAAARALRDAGVELLLFAGGDGTARNIFDAVGDSVAVLGIPAGVKIHSAVFANTPAAAGDLAALYLQGRREALRLREAEVMDIDEEAFRQGRVSARLYGYLRVPYRRTLVQSAKAGGVAGDAAELAGVAHDVVNDMPPATLYLLGPGTTTRAIVEALGQPKTLLGVDAVRDRKLVGVDLSEAQIVALLDRYGGGEPDGPAPQARIVITVIGGQGHIFGRGNQQLSPAVIRRVGTDHVIVVATQTKLLSLGGGPLLVDTGDPALDAELGGYTKVVTGLGERIMYRVGAPS